MLKLKPRQKHSRRDTNEDVELQPTLPARLKDKTGSTKTTTSDATLQTFDVRTLPERLRTNSVMTAMELLALEYEDPSDDEDCMVHDQTRTPPKLKSGKKQR